MTEILAINGVEFQANGIKSIIDKAAQPIVPVSSIETITPELAEKYLATQKVNRKPTRHRIKDYAERMLRGEWEISQPIQFTDEGDLFDGQHRLLAVIESGVTCDFIIMRGLPSKTRLYVDLGQARKTNQIAEIMGIGSSLNSKLATTKAMLIGQTLKPKNKSADKEGLKLRTGGARMTFSPHKTIELYLKHQEAIDFADRLTTPATAPVRGVVARAYYSQDHERLDQFIDVINSGFTITPYDEAAIALRNVMLTTKNDKKSGANYVTSLYKKTISSLSNFIAGNNVRFVKEKEIELYPVPDFD